MDIIFSDYTHLKWRKWRHVSGRKKKIVITKNAKTIGQVQVVVAKKSSEFKEKFKIVLKKLKFFG